MVLKVVVPDQLRLAVASAIKAPSIYNTQPWRFRILGTAARGIVDLYADRSRSLEALDPNGRQLETSCGVALLFLRVALRAAGFDADVTLLPDQRSRSSRQGHCRPGFRGNRR